MFICAYFQAVANYKGQNDFFSRLDPDGLCNKTLTEKTAKIQKLISRIYDRVKFERSFSEGWVIFFLISQYTDCDILMARSDFVPPYILNYKTKLRISMIFLQNTG